MWVLDIKGPYILELIKDVLRLHCKFTLHQKIQKYIETLMRNVVPIKSSNGVKKDCFV